MDLRLTQRAGLRAACALLMPCVVACGSADEPSGDARRFVGRFVFDDGVVLATCGGNIAAHDLLGTEIDIEQRGADEIDVVVGAACRLGLTVRDDVASTRDDAGCVLSIRSVALDATFQQFRVERSSSEVLEVFGAGVADAVIAEQPLRCDPFELSGALAPRGDS